jgi:hypothetical protein
MRTTVATLLCLAAAAVQAQTKIDTAFTATSVNVRESGTPVKIHVFRWSTEQERTPMLAALDPPPPPADGARAAGPRGEGAGRAGRAAAPARGARGRGRGAPPLSPVEAFTAAVRGAPTIGFIWTSDVTGYSIKYAWRSSPAPGERQRVEGLAGGERIVLVTDRRLGANTVGWELAPGAQPTEYEFTVLEMHLGAKGAGEARTSLTTKVVVDKESGTVALDNYAAAPAILQNIKRAGG